MILRCILLWRLPGLEDCHVFERAVLLTVVRLRGEGAPVCLDYGHLSSDVDSRETLLGFLLYFMVI